MYKKTIEYEDYNGVTRKEDFFFNLTKAELMEMELGTTGGYRQAIQKIIDAKDVPTIVSTFKSLILKCYGIKSEDGKRFIKSPEITEAFIQNEAYSILFMELSTDAKAGAEFVKGVMPKSLVSELENDPEYIAQMKSLN